jgi:uncharacterized damage-inducible protein DinB
MLTAKQVLLHRLTQERATLFHAMAFMPDEELLRRPVIGEWSVKDVLGHVAAWDAEFMRAIQQFLRGEPVAMLAIPDCDAWNAHEARLRWDKTLAEVTEELVATRRQLLGMVAGLPDEVLQRPGPHPYENRAFLLWLLNGPADHDREHWAALMDYKERWIAQQQLVPASIAV